MNHLAHFHLCGDSEELIVGALLGDYCKGPLRGEHPMHIEHGVRLHRRIDAFTDSHPALADLRRQFDRGPRRLAGVVMDVYFDHFLARHWGRFESRNLRDFCRHVYAALERHHARLPEAGQRHLQRMQEHELLPRYAELAVVEATLNRIGTRLGLATQMTAAFTRARVIESSIEDVFLAFYPQAIAEAIAFRCISAGPGKT